jgi:hypothetical protein
MFILGIPLTIFIFIIIFSLAGASSTRRDILNFSSKLGQFPIEWNCCSDALKNLDILDELATEYWQTNDAKNIRKMCGIEDTIINKYYYLGEKGKQYGLTKTFGHNAERSVDNAIDCLIHYTSTGGNTAANAYLSKFKGLRGIIS